SEGASIVGSRIDRSIIGIRSIIGPESTISNAIIMGNDYYKSERAEMNHRPLGIGEGTVLDGVIVDKNVRIGKGCRFVNAEGLDHFDGECFFIRDGIIVIPKDTVVPPNTKI
ncbi:glucose-1-phosphate adenylyltransferase, partial [Acidobacteriota bacterium]